MLAREPSAFEMDEADEAAADAEAMRAYEEGRVVSHNAVREWLLSWGAANERPRPEPGE